MVRGKTGNGPERRTGVPRDPTLVGEGSRKVRGETKWKLEFKVPESFRRGLATGLGQGICERCNVLK